MKSILPLAAAALALAACSGSNTEPTAANDTVLNVDEGLDANLSVSETDLNASDTALNATDANTSVDAAANVAEGNTAETAGNTL